jgi:hypothetical protein
MKFQGRRRIRVALLAICLCPLLVTGPCLTIAQQSVIEGAFDAITPLIVARLREELGLPALVEDATSGLPSGGSSTPYDSQPGM